MNIEELMQAVPEDAPVMVAWSQYKKSDDYGNSRKWAVLQEHTDGSMWASFYKGFLAGVVASMIETEKSRDAVFNLRAEARNAALEETAKVLDKLGVSGCTMGVIDTSTNVFECRRCIRGDCNCSEFDEAASTIRSLKTTAPEDGKEQTHAAQDE